MIRIALLSLLLCFLPTVGQAQIYDIEGTATVHYTGTISSPVGVGTYFTNQNGWGTKASFRTFAIDDTKLAKIERRSGIVVMLPGREGSEDFRRMKLPLSEEKTTTRVKQRELTVGLTRTLTNFTFYLEGGASLTRNYQGIQEDGKTLWIKHPDGFRRLHPTVEVGTALRLFEHVSVQAGYNYTSGKLLTNHEVTFGVGYTDFPSDWELF